MPPGKPAVSPLKSRRRWPAKRLTTSRRPSRGFVCLMRLRPPALRSRKPTTLEQITSFPQWKNCSSAAKKYWRRSPARSPHSKRSYETLLDSKRTHCARFKNRPADPRPHTLMLKKMIQNSPPFLIRYRSWLNAAFQAGLIFLSLLLACLLRFDFSLPDRLLLFSAAPILIVIRLAPIAYFGLLHGWWRYTGVRDALDIFKAVASGSALFWLALRFALGITSFPRSIYFLEALLTACLLAGVRVGSRLLAQSALGNFRVSKHVILIGAGSAAEMIIRETMLPDSGYTAVACVDDDPSKLGIRLHGVPVVGRVDQLPALLSSYPADHVLITVRSATGPQMEKFVEVCQQARVSFKTVPALRDILSGHVSINQVRDVNLDDLLGREPACIDLDSVRKQIEGRAVMVTGGAGSIGSELCR